MSETKNFKFEKMSDEEKINAKGGLQSVTITRVLKAPSPHKGERVKAHNTEKAAIKAGAKPERSSNKRLNATALQQEVKLDRCWHMYGCSFC